MPRCPTSKKITLPSGPSCSKKPPVWTGAISNTGRCWREPKRPSRVSPKLKKPGPEPSVPPLMTKNARAFIKRVSTSTRSDDAEQAERDRVAAEKERDIQRVKALSEAAI